VAHAHRGAVGGEGLPRRRAGGPSGVPERERRTTAKIPLVGSPPSRPRLGGGRCADIDDGTVRLELPRSPMCLLNASGSHIAEGWRR